MDMWKELQTEESSFIYNTEKNNSRFTPLLSHSTVQRKMRGRVRKEAK